MSICRLHHVVFYLLRQPWAPEKPTSPQLHRHSFIYSPESSDAFSHLILFLHTWSLYNRYTDRSMHLLGYRPGSRWWYRLSFRFNSFIDWYPSGIFEVTCQELSLNRYHSVIKKMKGGSTSWTQIKSVRGALWRDMTITRKPQRKSPFNGLNYFILMSCWT